MNKRAFFSTEERQKLLADFQASDLSVTEFARQNGLSRPLLSAWLRRYVRRPGQGPEPVEAPVAVPLEEIQIDPPWGQCRWAAEVVLPSGLRIGLDALGRTQLLEQVLRLC